MLLMSLIKSDHSNFEDGWAMNVKSVKYITLLAVCSLVSCEIGTGGKNHTKGDKKNSRLVVLGDSVAVGFMQETVMGRYSFIESRYLSEMFDAMRLGELPKHPSEYDNWYKSEHDNAFVGGGSISLATRLTYVESVNRAISGAKISSIESKQLRSADRDATHYVINVGANDFCHEENDFDGDAYIDSLKSLINALHERNHQAQILVMKIPNITHLFAEVAMQSDVAFIGPNLTSRRGMSTMPITCEMIRDGGLAVSLLPEGTPSATVNATKKSTSYCYPLSNAISGLTDKDSIHDRLKPYRDRLEEVNKKIEQLQEDSSLQVRNLVIADIDKIEFDKRHIASDCFHPSEAGLALFAEKAHEAVAHREEWQL